MSAWKSVTLGNLLVSSQYGTNEAPCENGNIAVIGMKNIVDSKITTNNLTTTMMSDKEIEDYLLSKGDILINRTNSYELVGKTGIFDSDIKAVFASYLVRLKPDTEKIQPYYLNYWLSSNAAQKTIKKIVTKAVSQANINPTELKKHCIIPLPSIAEQNKIISILSSVDDAINTTERLIEAKERYFRELSKKLLTVQKSENWHEVKLGTVCDISKGVQLSRSDMIENAIYPVLNGGIQASGYTDEWNTDANTITISEGGNSCGFVSYMTQNFWCGGHCYALKQVQINQEYLYHYLKANEKMIMSLRVGSGLPNIQKKALENFHIRYSKDEVQQSKIAEILNTAKREIDLLKKLVASYRVQKRGLMQKLLNGEWRVAG